MAEPVQTGEIVKRALAYPYATPGHSFVQLGTQTLELPAGGPDLSGRTPLLAYGSNAAPEALARKLAPLPKLPIPLLRGELDGFDVVYSAHVSFHGAVPGTLRPSPGTAAPVFIAYPTAEQRVLLTGTEPNYELTTLRDLRCRLETGAAVEEADAYLSRHGFLSVAGAEVALAAIEARGRILTAMDQPQVLELARSHLAPDLTLERFILRCVESGGLAPLPNLRVLGLR